MALPGEDRFRPLGNRLTETRPSSSGTIPQTHEYNPNRLNIQVLNPTPKQWGVRNGGAIIEMMNNFGKWYGEYRRNVETNRILGPLRQQLPSGRDYQVVVTNPGGRYGPERVDVYENGQFPGAIHSPESDVTVYVIRGSGSEEGPEGQPQKMSYPDAEGKPVEVSVSQPPSAPRPASRAPTKNSIEREPRGLLRGEPRQLPADSRFDRAYPGRRDVSRIA